jgi:hypothetical protein
LQNVIQPEPPPKLAADMHRTGLAMPLSADPPLIDSDGLVVDCGLPRRS